VATKHRDRQRRQLLERRERQRRVEQARRRDPEADGEEAQEDGESPEEGVGVFPAVAALAPMAASLLGKKKKKKRPPPPPGGLNPPGGYSGLHLAAAGGSGFVLGLILGYLLGGRR